MYTSVYEYDQWPVENNVGKILWLDFLGFFFFLLWLVYCMMAKSYKSVSQLSTLEAHTSLFFSPLIFFLLFIFFFVFLWQQTGELVWLCILFDCYDYLAIIKLTKLSGWWLQNDFIVIVWNSCAFQVGQQKI